MKSKLEIYKLIINANGRIYVTHFKSYSDAIKALNKASYPQDAKIETVSVF